MKSTVKYDSMFKSFIVTTPKSNGDYKHEAMEWIPFWLYCPKRDEIIIINENGIQTEVIFDNKSSFRPEVSVIDGKYYVTIPDTIEWKYSMKGR